MLRRLVGDDPAPCAFGFDYLCDRFDDRIVQLREPSAGSGVPQRVDAELQIQRGPVSRHLGQLVADQRYEVRQTPLGRYVGRIERLAKCIRLAGPVGLEQRQEQVLFVLEVGVDGALGEASCCGDLVQRGAVEAALGENLLRSVEKVVAGESAPALRCQRIECHGWSLAVYQRTYWTVC